jgi:hypothetical protein
VSNRYNIIRDRYGNENNVWDPKKIIRTTEKKSLRSKRFHDTHNIEEINSIQETNSESYNEGDFFSFPNMPSNQNHLNMTGMHTNFYAQRRYINLNASYTPQTN